MMKERRTLVTSRTVNRKRSDLNKSWALDCMLARSGVLARDLHNVDVAVHVVQVDLEAQVAVVGCDAHTVVGYRGDAGLDED
jgi:hypothetical protein